MVTRSRKFLSCTMKQNTRDVTDEVILELAERLDGKFFAPSERKEDWEFFMLDWTAYTEKLHPNLKVLFTAA
jgi:hypothetical protein